MAIAWWIDTGIYFKMEADITTAYVSDKASWTRPKVRENQPLTFSHVLPSIIIFGDPTFISMVAFAQEILPFLYRQHGQRKRVGRRHSQSYLMRSRVAPRRSTASPNTTKKAWA